MIELILLAVYILGIPYWIWMEKRFFPFQEGDCAFDFCEIYEITLETWRCDVCTRAFLWPLCVAFIIIILPIIVINKLFDKL